MTWRVVLARHASLTYGERVNLPKTGADLIGTAEVARILGKSPRTIHRLVQAGELVPTVIAPGGHHGAYLFRREDVEALAQEMAA